MVISTYTLTTRRVAMKRDGAATRRVAMKRDGATTRRVAMKRDGDEKSTAPVSFHFYSSRHCSRFFLFS